MAVRTAYSYVAQSEYDEKTAKSFEKVADENIKDGFLRRPEVIQAFAQMVCEAYGPRGPTMPESVSRGRPDECFDEEDEETKIKSLFEYVKWEKIWLLFYQRDSSSGKALRKRILSQPIDSRGI